MSEDKLTPQDIALLEQALPHLKDEQKVRALQKLRIYKKNWVQKHGKKKDLRVLFSYLRLTIYRSSVITRYVKKTIVHDNGSKCLRPKQTSSRAYHNV